jgi:hypothetical protein
VTGPVLVMGPPMLPESGVVLVPQRGREAETVRVERLPAVVGFAHRQTTIPTRVQLRFCRSSLPPVIQTIFGASIITAELADFK